MKQIGLFFGSFNPIHNGHLMLAQYMFNSTNIDEVWFVVSPQNPFKDKNDLVVDVKRLAMVTLATTQCSRMHACDIELQLPTPSYTIYTLNALRKKYPDYEFSIIMGGDNLEGLHKWRDAEKIISNYRILVYPRLGSKIPIIEGANIEVVNAPQMEISSTMLRNWLAEGKSIEYYTPRNVIEYIEQEGLYGVGVEYR